MSYESRTWKRALLLALFLTVLYLALGLGVGSGSSAVPVQESVTDDSPLDGPDSLLDPVADCAVSDTEVEPGESVTIDASGSEDVGYVRFDIDGDGNYELSDETDYKVTTEYSEEGDYTPVIEVVSVSGDTTDTATCSTISVVSNQLPDPDFSYSPINIEVGESVSFDSTSSDPDGKIVEYEWTVNGTTVGSSSSLTYTFDEPGDYSVKLTVTDDDGATNWVSKVISVESVSPTAKCTATPTEVETGETVTLDASGSENVGFVRFDTDGDGSYERSDETDFAIETSYSEAGDYTPRVEVVSSSGDQTDTATCGTITVTSNKEPTADFSYSPSNPSVGETVSFQSNSNDPDGEIAGYQWIVDGKNVSTSSSFSYTFDNSGDHIVILVVEDNDGLTATVSKRISVASEPPSAVCTATPTEVETGETVTLDASGSENVGFVRFDTDGDGSYERSDETDFVVETSYPEEGEYTPEVEVVSSSGDQTDTATCGTITVTSNKGPTADFSYSPSNPSVGESVSFQSNSNDPDGEIQSYEWRVDGETVGEGPRFSYTFDQPGDHSVTLVVKDDEGAPDHISKTVTVNSESLAAACKVSKREINPGDSVTIDASGSTNAELVRFDTDGDGSYERSDETDFAVETSYPEEGEYTPRVEVVSGDRSDTAECGTITVSKNITPVADFSYSPSQVTTGESVDFVSEAADRDGKIAGYIWRINGNRVSDSQSFEYTFDEPGEYRVTLVVEDSDGATDTANRILEVTEEKNKSPIPNFTYSPRQPEIGDTVSFDSFSRDDDGDLVKHEWFVDGELVATGSSMDWVFKTAGEHKIKLRVEDDANSTSTKSKTITVKDPENRNNKPPRANFDYTPTKPNLNNSVSFESASSDPDGKIVGYRWRIDGTTVSTSQEFSYTFDEPGEHTVTLVVQDSKNATATTSKTVNVVDSSEGSDSDTEDSGTDTDDSGTDSKDSGTDSKDSGTDSKDSGTDTDDSGTDSDNSDTSRKITSNQPPEASFDIEPSQPEPGEEIRFVATSTDPDNPIKSSKWVIDGTSVSSQSTFTFTFDQPGEYNVTLKVNDGRGETDSVTRTITVAENNSETGEGQPGFGVLVALIAVLIIGAKLRLDEK